MLRPFALMERATCRRITRKETCPSTKLPTTILKWIDLESNLALRGERPATDRLSHGTSVNNNSHFNYI
jgi:hypothetical protein